MSSTSLKKLGKGKHALDWREASLAGGAVLLGLVKEAAAMSSFPFLREAAGTTLSIVQTVQAVKDNKVSFQLLADDSTGIIAAIWDAHQNSHDQANWPPHELAAVIKDLVSTLDAILKFVTEKVSRNRAIRIMYSVADIGKINEYRVKLQTAVSKFEVSSHLSINDTLRQLLKNQNELKAALDANGIAVYPPLTDAEKVLAKVHEDEARARRREEERLEEERKAKEAYEHEQSRKEEGVPVEYLKLKEEEAKEQARRDEEYQRLRAAEEARERARKEQDYQKLKAAEEARELDRKEEEYRKLKAAEEAREQARKEEERRKLKAAEEAKELARKEDEYWKLKAVEEARRDEYAREELRESRAAAALLEAERDELERYRAMERKAFEEQTREERLRTEGKRRMKPTVPFEREDDDETVVDEEGGTTSEDELLARIARARAKKAAKKKPNPSPQPQPSPPQEQMYADFGRMGFNPAAAAAASHSPPPLLSPYPPWLGSPPYQSPVAPPMMAYAAPGYVPMVNNYNSGNVSHSTVSNVGNDYSVNYAPPARRRNPRTGS